MKMGQRCAVLAATAILAWSGMTAAALAEKYEAPPAFKASSFVPAELLQGAHHQLYEKVLSDGFMLQFTIRSHYGTFEVSSVDMVKTRINELAALAELDRISRDKAFAEGFKKAAAEIGDELTSLYDNPRETLEGVGDGVGRFFERAYRAGKTGVQRVGDAWEKGDAPPPPPTGPGTKLPGASEGAGQQVYGDVVTVSAKAAGKATSDVFGYDDQRRKLAKQLRVDPYTTNPVLSKKLDDVAWSSFAGGLGISVLKSVVPGGMALSVVSGAADWVWDMPPGDLRVSIEKELLGMGVTQEQIDLFLRHPKYSLTMQARLAKALQSLKDAANRAAVMPLALSVGAVGQARFLVDSLEMLADASAKDDPIMQLEVHGTVMGRTKKGALVVPAATGYVSWSETLHNFATREDLAALKRTAMFRGPVSPLAQTRLTALGWQLRENVQQ